MRTDVLTAAARQGAPMTMPALAGTAWRIVYAPDAEGVGETIAAAAAEVRADTAIRTICRAALHERQLFGDQALVDARRRILFALIEPRLDLVASVARGSGVPLDGDLDREAMQHFLVTRLEYLVEHTFDFEIALHSSPTGWARQALRRCAQWYRRPRPTATLDIEHPAERTSNDDELEQGDEVTEELRGTRGYQRLQVASASIVKVLGIPRLALPSRRSERDALLATVRSDPDAAIASLVAYQRLLEEHDVVEPEQLDGLETLWAGWRWASVDDLLSRSRDLVLAHVTSSLSPRPRPAERSVIQFRAAVRSLSNRRGWTKLSIATIDAWIAEHCAAVNDFDGVTDPAEADERRAEAARAWPRLGHEMIDWPGSPVPANDLAGLDTFLSKLWSETGLQ